MTVCPDVMAELRLSSTLEPVALTAERVAALPSTVTEKLSEEAVVVDNSSLYVRMILLPSVDVVADTNFGAVLSGPIAETICNSGMLG